MILRNGVRSRRVFTFSRAFATADHVSPLELTIAIIKPHAVVQPYVVQDITDVLSRDGFITVRRRTMRLTRSDASEFYKEHFGRFFFQRAVELMSSGPIVISLLARHQAIQRWRSLMGPTKVAKTRFTHPESLRARFGLTDTRNAVHGSDSIASTAKECKFFFPDFDAGDWYKRVEPLCRFSTRVIASNQPAGLLTV